LRYRPLVVAEERAEQPHGGRLIARRLAAHGVSHLFTLAGGHLFSIYDGCRAEGIEIVDVRHEQTAAFAAEGWAKVTCAPGVCALTAGPGVTNGMSAIASAAQCGSPMLVLGGRAPKARWGQGSLQEVDHVQFVRPLARLAATAESTAEIPALLEEAFAAASGPRGGPAFVDFPLDVVFGTAPEPPGVLRSAPEPPGVLRSAPELTGAGAGRGEPSTGGDRLERVPIRLGEPSIAAAAPQAVSSAANHGAEAPDTRAFERAAALLARAERPVVMAGAGLYWGRGEVALRTLAERLRIPVCLNSLGRGCLPADHELCFSRARSAALGQADVVLLIGAPLDFRLGFGAVFAPEAELITLDAAEPERPSPRPLAAGLYGPLPETLAALTAAVRAPLAGGSIDGARQRWIGSLRQLESERRSAEAAELADGRAPLHPMRIYGELAPMLDRDAIVIGDGGDFVSFAGRLLDSFEPGCWLDPGPYGCLGTGPGYALAARLARPGRQVVLLLGDGALGFSAGDLDTLARHRIGVVAIVANNGIWALEKHPMEALYGYSVAAELRPGTRYDLLAEALGCRGELVRRPAELRPALERAFAASEPVLVNVLTDPSVAYPRRSSLA
jgi:acetolactate synthase-1/2/3 large subunit